MPEYIIFSDEFPVITWPEITPSHKIMVGIDETDAQAIYLLGLLRSYHDSWKVENDTALPLTLTDLNTLYPTALVGFQVVCPAAGWYYEKVLGTNGGEPDQPNWIKWGITYVDDNSVGGIFDLSFDPAFN